ncbi:MAG: hypothetical protein IKH31_07925 [Clostridia bacterium]|jgi:hypothetical protein|nr:hypothetical protein [Clostridia bacterium]MBQ4446666.1 hypothetical protein [Clostridia bacterium]MBR3487475.1 hypothetical protein [Clostridia bacterium]
MKLMGFAAGMALGMAAATAAITAAYPSVVKKMKRDAVKVKKSLVNMI